MNSANANQQHRDLRAQCVALAKTLDQRSREWRKKEILLRDCINKLSSCLIASNPTTTGLINRLNQALSQTHSTELEQTLHELHRHIQRAPKRAKDAKYLDKLPDPQSIEPLYQSLYGLFDELSPSDPSQQQHAHDLRADLLSQRGTPIEMVTRMTSLLQHINAHSTLESESFQHFMEHLSERFSDIEQHLNAGQLDNQHSRDIAIEINHSIKDEASMLSQQSIESCEIKQLQSLIEERVLSISERMDEFQSEEVQRIEAAEARNVQLRQRLKAMEDETDSLRQKLNYTSEQLRTDPLTGVANRYAYERFFSQSIARVSQTGNPCFFALWDIDHFKKINDNFGHSSGDRVLKIVAEVLSECFVEPAFFARVGGEEFALILPDVDQEHAIAICESARQAVQKSGFNYRGERLDITMSCGISAFAAELSQDEIFKRADRALYQAKNGGRNQVVFFQAED